MATIPLTNYWHGSK